MQENIKCWHDWVVKVIHWDLCKRLIFDHTDKWYMHKSETFLENKTKILGKFMIKTNHSILARRTDLVLINIKKRTF